MAATKSGKQGTQGSAKRTSTAITGFTAEEKAAMKQRAKELKAAASAEDAEKEVLAKIAAMAAHDRAMGKRIHEIVRASAPGLVPRLWYGMPAYAKDEKIVCHFQDAQKFKTRYATLGFSDEANLDEGVMWPVAYALKELNAAAEAKISALVKKAAS